jgi:NAD(P)H-dependent flavin oxidoreductase YrpB (nitropropane dioxygenase family)
MDRNPFFPCRHPLLCAAMNQVSDVALAIAVQRAGALPSLSIANCVRDGRFDADVYRQALTAYKDATGSAQLLLSVGGEMLLHDAVVAPFLDLGFRHIELFHWHAGDPHWPAVLARSRQLRDRHGVRFVFKVSTGHLDPTLDHETVLLKGPEGAGRSVDDALPLDQAFAWCRQAWPHTDLIVSGGIHGHAQVAHYLQAGAIGVSVGTLFAATRESSVSDEVKRKLVAAQARDLDVRGSARLRGLFASVVPDDSRNLTRTLARGVRRADEGGIFVGHAVDHITEILSVQQVVDRLTQPSADDAPA